MAGRSLALMGKIAWICALVLIGVVAIGLQMDRDARKDITLARSVPSIFRGSAFEMLARSAYAAGENEQGLAYSRELVARRPLPAENLGLLTRGLIASGSSDAALQALLAAAQRGWRDRFTQYIMITSAQQVDDPQVAAQRLLALWRQSDQGREARALTRDILADDATATQFARGMIGTDAWAMDFLSWSTRNLSVKAVAAVADAMVKNHIAVNCGQLSNTLKAFAQTGRVRIAMNIWSGLCAKGPATLPDAFDFKKPDREAGPFDWKFPSQPGLSVELVEEGGNTSLQYENTDQLHVAIATRAAALAPGMHTARIEAKGSRGIDAQSVTLQVKCVSESGSTKLAASVELSGQNTSFQIPEARCTGQELSLLSGRGEGLLHRLVIDS